MRGREGRGVYGEALTPEQGDLKTMGNICCSLRKGTTTRCLRPPEWARRFQPEDFLHRPIRSYEYGYWWIELGGEINTIKDNRSIRHELVRTLLEFGITSRTAAFPGCRSMALEWVGMLRASGKAVVLPVITS